MVKIHRLKGDITPEIANSFKESVAIDTEATGLQIPERDKLSLIQICGEDGEVYIIQPDRKNYKSPNLVSVLENRKIIKIGHFLRFDKNALEYFLKCKIKNIFDTKIASKLARSYSDSHSLKTLIKEFINIDISKQFQNSDFGGELTPAQLKYCANDVIYLHKIHEELNKILEREKRIDLYKDCLMFLKTRVELDLASFKDDIWSH